MLVRFFSFFGGLASKRLIRSDLEELRAMAIEVVAELERVLPACESGVLRHMVIHMAERAARGFPPWVHAMWPFERMWGRLTQWLKQKNNPAASIMRGYLAYSVARSRSLPKYSACDVQHLRQLTPVCA